MRIIFAGTPDFSASCLDALLPLPDHEIVAVYTQPDRRAGRGKKLQASAVKQLAVENGLVVEQPLSLKADDAQQQLAAYNADVMVVAAYGLLLPAAVLQAPRLGCINIHASLLPRWRGAAPVERAILAGDDHTGITIMQMDEGLDTGLMLAKRSCSINSDETGDSLRSKLVELACPLLVESLASLEALQGNAQPQDDADACYASKLEKSEALIDWHCDADTIERKIRAFTSAMRCSTDCNGQAVKIIAATAVDEAVIAMSSDDYSPGEVARADRDGLLIRCQPGWLLATEIQLPGTKPMTVAQVLNGRAELFRVGVMLGRTAQ